MILWEMTNHKRKPSKIPNRVPAKDACITKTHDPRALQDLPISKKDDFLYKKQKLLDETQSYKYSQSSKFSSVSRTLVLGIMGTTWILTYTDGKLYIPNLYLSASLFICLLFLLVDVIHYYSDSISYQRELCKLDQYRTVEDLDKTHEKTMNTINKRSNRFIVAKFWILICASVLFFIGIFTKMVLFNSKS